MYEGPRTNSYYHWIVGQWSVIYLPSMITTIYVRYQTNMRKVLDLATLFFPVALKKNPLLLLLVARVLHTFPLHSLPLKDCVTYI